MSPAEQNAFLVGIVKTILQIKDAPPSNQPRSYAGLHADMDTAQQQMAVIRRQERAAWVERNLTDEQRMERARQEVAMRNGTVRQPPTVFGDNL